MFHLPLTYSLTDISERLMKNTGPRGTLTRICITQSLHLHVYTHTVSCYQADTKQVDPHLPMVSETGSYSQVFHQK